MTIAEKTALRTYLNTVVDLLPLPILDREWSERVACEAPYSVALERRFGPAATAGVEKITKALDADRVSA